MAERSTEDIVERAGQLAENYEKTCTGCAQSTVAGLLDAFGLQDNGVFKAASGLAFGIGLTGDGPCGSLTGGGMVIGLVLGRERKHHQDILKPMKSYELCGELHADFIQQYGSCRCYDIQEKLMGRTFNLLDPKDFEEAGKIGLMEHCSRVVGRATRKAAEIILREQEGGQL
jgi:C_GCAxxG_C_C family probable redox protein